MVRVMDKSHTFWVDFTRELNDDLEVVCGRRGRLQSRLQKQFEIELNGSPDLRGHFTFDSYVESDDNGQYHFVYTFLWPLSAGNRRTALQSLRAALQTNYNSENGMAGSFEIRT
jgi:hypothetical protein